MMKGMISLGRVNRHLMCSTGSIYCIYIHISRKSIMNLQEVINEQDLTRKTEISSLDDETNATFIGDFPSCKRKRQ